jgi:hypothetical protein
MVEISTTQEGKRMIAFHKEKEQQDNNVVLLLSQKLGMHCNAKNTVQPIIHHQWTVY